MPRGLLSTLIVAIAVLAFGGCGGDAPEPPAGQQRPQVVAAFYPLEEAARAIGGAQAEIIGLTPPGQGPHDLELGAPELRAIEDADLSFFLGSGFQPQVERAGRASDGQAVDLLDAATLRRVDAPVRGVRGEVDGEVVAGDRDPHVWVDPALFLRLVDAVEAAYVSSDPAGRDLYERNARRYREGIEALDRAFARGLGACDSRTLVTSHAAFGYLADRYGLEQAPIAGISPDDEPDPRSLAATARRAKADGVRTVFFESLVPPDLAETVASEIGADTSFLDPVEGLTREDLEAGSTYTSVMRENLERLREGLGCTG
ncbi:MAG: zinc ABC transporter substrate-binding protein [Solirubrobacteraceae bacterium MAG38_C4-C5]|nr:zinc ABC transporter substrate-binding protein [Candidatus Siliceabacter maunaloa]